VQPRDTDAISDGQELAPVAQRVDHADDLVSGDDGESRQRQVAFDDVEIGAATRARDHAEADLTGRGLGERTFDGDERS
jgi:hypothetical protein